MVIKLIIYLGNQRIIYLHSNCIDSYELRLVGKNPFYVSQKEEGIFVYRLKVFPSHWIAKMLPFRNGLQFVRFVRNIIPTYSLRENDKY